MQAYVRLWGQTLRSDGSHSLNEYTAVADSSFRNSKRGLYLVYKCSSSLYNRRAPLILSNCGSFCGMRTECINHMRDRLRYAKALSKQLTSERWAWLSNFVQEASPCLWALFPEYPNMLKLRNILWQSSTRAKSVSQHERLLDIRTLDMQDSASHHSQYFPLGRLLLYGSLLHPI